MLQEVNRVLDKDGSGSLREEHLTQMPYVKGVIKECLRLYPVAPFLSRVLDKEITLNGFRVPAGVSQVPPVLASLATMMSERGKSTLH